MRILGITGGIGAGKTTAVGLLRHLNIPIHCSDHAVHKALKEDKTVIQKVQSQWPSVVQNGQIMRRALGEIVFNNHQALDILEKILFPEVYKSQKRFLKKHARLRNQWVVLDIPLLFETNAQKRLDAVASLMASEETRIQRVMRRPNVKFQTLKGVLERQVNDRTRKLNSDFLLQSGLSRASLMPQLKKVLGGLSDKGNPKWVPGWGDGK